MIFDTAKYRLGRLIPFFPAFLFKSCKLQSATAQALAEMKAQSERKLLRFGFDAAHWGEGLAISKWSKGVWKLNF